jgi:hypothetical protein
LILKTTLTVEVLICKLGAINALATCTLHVHRQVTCCQKTFQWTNPHKEVLIAFNQPLNLLKGFVRAKSMLHYISTVKIATLNHEVLNHPMKGRALKTYAFLTCKNKR